MLEELRSQFSTTEPRAVELSHPDDDDDETRTMRGFVVRDDETEHGTLTRPYNEYLVIDDHSCDGAELWERYGYAETAFDNYVGDIVAVDEDQFVTGGWATQLMGFVTQSSGMRDWFYDRADNRYREWHQLVEHAVRTLENTSVHRMVDACNYDGLHRELRAGDFRADEPDSWFALSDDDIDEPKIRAAKRANVRYDEDLGSWLCYGKDRSCQFEGRLWHMLVFALYVVSSPNTEYLAAEYAVANDPGDRAETMSWCRPDLRYMADELRRYTGTPYVFYENGVQASTPDVDRDWNKTEFDVDELLSRRTETLSDYGVDVRDSAELSVWS